MLQRVFFPCLFILQDAKFIRYRLNRICCNTFENYRLNNQDVINIVCMYKRTPLMLKINADTIVANS